jgi:hypothetical protein
MANNFKSDDSFLKKLAVGAAGTNATIENLVALGYSPIELERGARGFKIWKRIKIKRVRVPDLLCLSTGLRFESRGKTKVEISMSHSVKDPKRTWDAGMHDDDYVSVVVLNQTDDSPTRPERVSPVHYVSVRSLRDAFNSHQVTITKPKGVDEGSEIRVVWTCASANKDSTVEEVTGTRIRLRPTDQSKVQTIQLSRSKGAVILAPLVSVNDVVQANQIVASVADARTTLPPPTYVDEQFFAIRLTSMSLSERYAAAKALRYRGYSSKTNAILLERMNDSVEDIYVQLEAAAALAAHGVEAGWDFLEDKINSNALLVPLETQLETVIVASEIAHQRSEKLLIKVLMDRNRDEELRAGAAWALGQFETNTSALSLIGTFNSNPLDIRIEAARALLKISGKQVPFLIDQLKKVEQASRDGIAWVLARSETVDLSSLLTSDDDLNLRGWASYVIGLERDKFDQKDLDAICSQDPEVYFATSVLWQIVQSWINQITEY